MLARHTGHALRLNSPKRYVFVCTGYIAAALDLLESQPSVSSDYMACNLAYKQAESLSAELSGVQQRAQHIRGLSDEDRVVGIACVAIVQHVSDILLADMTRAGTGAHCSLRPAAAGGAEDQSDTGGACHICTERFSQACIETDPCPSCGRADMCEGCESRVSSCPWCRSPHVGRLTPSPRVGEGADPLEVLFSLADQYPEIVIHVQN